MKNNVSFSENERVLTARLDGEIDHHTARAQREEIDSMLYQKKPAVLEIDFSAVRFMDSSGIALIIGRADVASGLGVSVRVIGLSPILLKLVRLSGVGKLKNLTIVEGEI